MAKTYLKLFHTYLYLIEGLSNEERGRLLTAIITYSSTGNIIPMPGNEKFVFPSIQINIDLENNAYNQKVARLKANKEKATCPKCDADINIAGEQDSKNVSDICPEIRDDIKTEINPNIYRHHDRSHISLKEQEQEQGQGQGQGQEHLSLKESGKRKNAVRFSPPTLDEIKDYCFKNSLQVDPESFFDYYSANGWMLGKSPMLDWRPAIRRWEKNEFASVGARKGSSKATPFPSSFDTDDFFEAAVAQSLRLAEELPDEDDADRRKEE